MSSFTTELQVSPLPNGKHWKLTKGFRYHVGNENSRRVIRIPKGFETDFASVPKVFLPLLPFWAKYSKAPVVHDYLYRIKAIGSKPISRLEADIIFYEAMVVAWQQHRFFTFWAGVEYVAVRFFGRQSWHNKTL